MSESPPPSKSSRFAPTQWSLVLAAGRIDGSTAEAALVQLCRTYWYPLYAFVRRRGTNHHDAQDLTQAFFATLLAKNYLGEASRERGRFRTFLLASLKNFLANDWHKRNARKRGGGIVFVPLDAAASDRFEREARSTPSNECTPEEVFDRRWAHTVIERALARLRSSYDAKDQTAIFDALKPCLTQGRGAVRYAGVAQALGMDENAVKVAAHRLRRRFREAIREEIAATVSEVDEIEEEFRYLREVLARS